MASYVLLDVTTLVAGYDMTTDMNQLSFNNQVDELDSTTFGNGGYRSRVGGLKDLNAELAGYWNAGAPSIDNDAFADLGTTDRVVTMSPTGDESDVCYMWRGVKLAYSMFGEVGKLAPFSLGMTGSSGQGAIRGALAKSKTNVTVTGATGAGLQLGAVGAAQFLYATFHVFSAGTTITGVIESDDNVGFTSATTRMTFGPTTTVGGTWGTRVAGSIADMYYRLRITAITGTFSIACAIGIGV